MRTTLSTPFILTFLLLASLFLASCAQQPLIAQQNDTVAVIYTGSFENGSVFDTNNIVEAQRLGIPKTELQLKTLDVTLGAHQVVSGFEQALYGMKKDETKSVTLSPEQAYGPSSPEKIAHIPIVREQIRFLLFDRKVIVPTDVFLKDHPDAVVGTNVSQGGQNYTVRAIALKNVTLFLQLAVGMQVQIPQAPWNGTAVNVSETRAIVRQDPTDGLLMQTSLGPARITVKPETIRTQLLLQAGGRITSKDLGSAIITSVNSTDATIDFNHPLAGKTLVFDITVVGISRRT
jgi:FKBP-type peptidyl-prolyl cis-trans isomerase 2